MEAIPDVNFAFRAHKIEIIVIPTKATESVDWEAAIKESFSSQERQDLVSESASHTQTCREVAIASKDQSITCNLARYYRTLDSLGKKVEGKLNINFTWIDAFDSSISASQSSLAFEKANVLFNVAANLSQAAKIKNEARNFQLAASVLSYVSENFLHPPLMDLSQSALSFLSTLMLAQAQDAAVIQAQSQNKSKITVARLSLESSILYGQCWDALSRPDLTELKICLLGGSDFDKDAVSLIELKKNLWKGFSLYLVAENLIEFPSRIGEAIRLLSASLETLEMGMRENKFNKESLAFDFLKSLTDHVERTLSKAQKDNDLIYNAKVPDLETVSLPEPIKIAQIIPLQEILIACGAEESEDKFGFVMTTEFIENASRYSEEKSKLLRYETSRIATADDNLSIFLASHEGFDLLRSLKDLIMEFRDPNQCYERILSKAAPIALVLSRPLKIKNQIKWSMREVEKQNVILSSELAQSCQTHSADPKDPDYAGLMESFYDKIANIESQLQRLSEAFSRILLSEPFVSLQKTSGILMSLESLKLALKMPKSAEMEDMMIMATTVEKALGDLEGLRQARQLELSTFRMAILEDELGSEHSSQNTIDDGFSVPLGKFDKYCNHIEQNILQQELDISIFLSNLKKASALLQASEFQSSLKFVLKLIDDGAPVALDCKSNFSVLEKELTSLEKKVQEAGSEIEGFLKKRSETRALSERLRELSSAEENQKFLIDRLNKLQIKRSSPSHHDLAQDSPGNSGNVNSNSKSLLD